MAPLINNINYYNLDLYIKSKLLKSSEEIPISIVQLYQFCKEFDNLYNIERFKGVGSMEDYDRKMSCMNKDTRTIYKISSIGDLDIIYGALGNDSNFRKNNFIINQGDKIE